MEYFIHVRDKWAAVWTDSGWKSTTESKYVRGLSPPRYPLPAIRITVGWQPAHHSQPYPSAYWWVCSRSLLWSFFERYGLVVEKD